MLPIQQLFIDGRLTDAASGETFATINPATGREICRVQRAGAEDVERAVESAARGFATWSAMTGAELEVLDTGKPIAEAATVDVISGAECLEYFAGLAPSIAGQHITLRDAFVYTRREPLGICAGIGAWNYPLQVACWKSAPALACGNAMIFKPAELTPLTASRLAEIYIEAGVPPGVFNIVHGDGAVGRLLATHPGIAKVSLTGEVATGRKVMADAAATLKKVTMELGGKSPLIVFADADLDNAVSAALLANFYTQGEICTNGTRVFVEKKLLAAFLDRLIERTRRLRVGDPMQPDTEIGALISATHRDRVLSYIEAGKTAGATLLCGGGIPADPALADGYFVMPTIFAECTDEMAIVREEIFGPVMAVLAFENEAEVVRRANDTPFGLAAGIFTRDLARAHRVVAALEAGVCWINNYNVTPVEAPFGGSKQSGIGRENGTAAIEHYTQLKSVYVELGDVACPYG